jgi:hypothetical protein
VIIATDGGNWALFHLFSCVRNAPVNFALSTIAATPSHVSNMPVLLIGDGSFWQKSVLESLDIPFLNLPQRGTVTASALDLAFALTSGAVFIAGMDLANDDIAAHARPYALDFTSARETRFTPAYSETFARVMGANASMNIYAEWFKQKLPHYPQNIFTIGKNHSIFANLPSYDRAQDLHGERFAPKFYELSGTDRGDLLNKAEKNLIRALQNEESIQKELYGLLFPESPDSLEEMIEKIKRIVTEIS